MGILTASSVLLAAYASMSFLTLASAQTTSPSNSSLPVSPAAPQLQLLSRQTPMETVFDVDPLTVHSGLNLSVQQLNAISIQGPLVLTTPYNTDSLGNADIAYISCDPEAYQNSHIDATATIRAAALKISQVSNNADSQQGAIILYSSYSTFCTYNAPDTFVYQIIYTTTNASQARILAAGLKLGSVPGQTSTIQLDQSSVANTSNAIGPSPTTAVAMIILYSITGIITALFLIIIVTGAIRAHRHPERYGPRNVIGRPRQSRAKGIARAMLETLPIVKFGESEEENKAMPMPGNEMELGEARPTGQVNGTTATERAVELGAAGATARETAVDDAASSHSHDHDHESDHTTDEQKEKDKAAEDHTGHLHVHPTIDTGDANTNNGLACSVCTDDFVKGQDTRVLPCGHKFHPECIDPWLLNVSGTCPLCRIDLRPPPSNEPDMPDMLDMPDPMLDGDMPLAMPMPVDNSSEVQGESATHNRRRLTVYLQQTLNARRMRDATPEERLAALRNVRRARRNAEAASQGLAVGERARNRMTLRLNRLWPSRVHGDNSGSSPSTPAIEQVPPVPTAVSTPPTGMSQRNSVVQ